MVPDRSYMFMPVTYRGDICRVRFVCCITSGNDNQWHSKTSQDIGIRGWNNMF